MLPLEKGGLPEKTGIVDVAHESVLSNATTTDCSLFLVLPIELRLQIYDLLLVSRVDEKMHPSCPDRLTNLDQKPIPLNPHHSERGGIQHLEPQILRTCKQIYREAIPILYSCNILRISRPEDMLQLIANISPINIKLIKCIDLYVKIMAEASTWVALFNTLAKEANGLRSVEIEWRGMRRPDGGFRGLGDDLDFMCALAKIQGLERMEISGYYPKHWPEYLEAKMGVRVQAMGFQEYLEAQWLGKGKPNGQTPLQIPVVVAMRQG